MRVTFNENEYTPSSSVLPLLPEHEEAFPFARHTSPVQVEVETLDGLIESLRPTPPCLLKVDVQGYEREVLTGGRQFLTYVDDLIIECSLRPLYRGAPPVIEIIKDLYERGFELADVGGDLRDAKTRRALQVDLLFSRVKSST